MSWSGGPHSLAFAVALLGTWLGNGLVASVIAAILIPLLFVYTLMWAQELEDPWDDFKETKRVMYLGLPAVILTPVLGIIVGSAL